MPDSQKECKIVDTFKLPTHGGKLYLESKECLKIFAYFKFTISAQMQAKEIEPINKNSKANVITVVKKNLLVSTLLTNEFVHFI